MFLLLSFTLLDLLTSPKTSQKGKSGRKSNLESYTSLTDLTWYPMHEHSWQPGEEEEGDVGGEGHEQEEEACRCTGEN